MELDGVPTRLDYAATANVRDFLGSIGRTEDVRFSPSNTRLAIAGFLRNKIAVFDISLHCSPSRISLTGVAEISSTYLKHPHGLDFVDDEKILVANRDGHACV